jgi:hypothetical protein
MIRCMKCPMRQDPELGPNLLFLDPEDRRPEAHGARLNTMLSPQIIGT